MSNTKPMEWLLKTQGVNSLSPKDFDAVRDFTLLWGLFEGRAMANRGSQNELAAAVDRMILPDCLPMELEQALAFWRDRYWHGSEPSGPFVALGFSMNPHREATMQVLSGTIDDASNAMKALLQITMRLRNNLFHGVKWQYHLYDQLQNFTHANAVLMAATELSPPQL